STASPAEPGGLSFWASLGRSIDASATLVRPGTRNLEAYNLYLQGRFYHRRVFTAMDKAIGFFRQAGVLDPGFAAAHAGLAYSYAYLGYSNKWFLGKLIRKRRSR